ncbi:MAG: potassium channel family protein [Alphaproteobacteria bacterium]
MANGLWLGLSLIVICISIHYEALRRIWNFLPRMHGDPRLRVVVVVLAATLAHFTEIGIYALAYYGAEKFAAAGAFGGEIAGAFTGIWADYVYFSAVSYTTLGYGDIVPTGAMRLMAASESFVGLLTITWSASFTYLTMERFWPLHATHHHPGKRGRG